eukprot:1203819-Alexandrium_andersonii.AAC.1
MQHAQTHVTHTSSGPEGQDSGAGAAGPGWNGLASGRCRRPPAGPPKVDQQSLSAGWSGWWAATSPCWPAEN